MKRFATLGCALVISGPAIAENIEGADEIICASGDTKLCLETGECYEAAPYQLSVPDFVIVDIKKKTLKTTKANPDDRVTDVSLVESEDGTLVLQGIENQRAFSIIIDELTGRMTASITRDGLTVAVFGACTDTDL